MLHVLAPEITHLSPVRSARVITLARSEPPLGSLKSCTSVSSPRMAAAMRARFCSSEPVSNRVAAQIVKVGVLRMSGIS